MVKVLIERTESHVPGLENYDIREDKGAFESLTKFRQESDKDAAMIADIRADFVRGENELRTRVPSLKVEYNNDIRTPEVITPDVYKSNIERLTAPSEMKRSEILRNFVKENNSLIGVSTDQADSLRVLADYTNPNGYLSFAHLEQLINGVPVFRGEVKAGFTKDGQNASRDQQSRAGSRLRFAVERFPQSDRCRSDRLFVTSIQNQPSSMLKSTTRLRVI